MKTTTQLVKYSVIGLDDGRDYGTMSTRLGPDHVVKTFEATWVHKHGTQPPVTGVTPVDAAADDLVTISDPHAGAGDHHAPKMGPRRDLRLPWAR